MLFYICVGISLGFLSRLLTYIPKYGLTINFLIWGAFILFSGGFGPLFAIFALIELVLGYKAASLLFNGTPEKEDENQKEDDILDWEAQKKLEELAQLRREYLNKRKELE